MNPEVGGIKMMRVVDEGKGESVFACRGVGRASMPATTTPQNGLVESSQRPRRMMKGMPDWKRKHACSYDVVFDTGLFDMSRRDPQGSL